MDCIDPCAVLLAAAWQDVCSQPWMRATGWIHYDPILLRCGCAQRCCWARPFRISAWSNTQRYPRLRRTSSQCSRAFNLLMRAKCIVDDIFLRLGQSILHLLRCSWANSKCAALGSLNSFLGGGDIALLEKLAGRNDASDNGVTLYLNRIWREK
jgi:hypothetical protein